MSKKRWLDTCYWDDKYIHRLKPLEKFFYLYLITGPLTNISGVYQIDIDRIWFDTGIKIKNIEIILKKFQNDEKIYYLDGWMVVRNFIKHQNITNIHIREGIQRELLKCPKDLLQYTYNVDTVLKK